MQLSSLDPSLAVGFYCSDKKDFDDFWKRAGLVSMVIVVILIILQLSQMDNPIFTLQDEAPEYRQQEKSSLSLEEFEDDIVIL
jgi:hypothetical protein